MKHMLLLLLRRRLLLLLLLLLLQMQMLVLLLLLLLLLLLRLRLRLRWRRQLRQRRLRLRWRLRLRLRWRRQGGHGLRAVGRGVAVGSQWWAGSAGAALTGRGARARGSSRGARPWWAGRRCSPGRALASRRGAGRRPPR